MFSEVRVHNFKAFDEMNVNLFPITLFLGPNNSGKSSILSTIRLLGQTLESRDMDVPLLLNGIFGDFGTYKDIVYGNHRGRPIQLNISCKVDKSIMANISAHLEYKFRTIRRELILNKIEIYKNDNVLVATEYSKDSDKQLLNQIGDINVPSSLKSTVSQNMRIQNFLPRVSSATMRWSKDSKLKEFYNDDVTDATYALNESTFALTKEFRNCDYLSAMRMSPERTYLFTGEKRTRIGANGENASNLLVMDLTRADKDRKNLVELVGKWLKKADIAEKIVIEPLSDRHYEIRVKHAISKETQNLADVGFGNSQIFPVLVGGYNMRRGSTFMVEEPEIHLHPKAQAELGDFFLDLYESGIQSLVETHSEHLILRIQQHIADNKISPEDVGVYYVYATEGKKQIKRLNLDKKGCFIDEWPHGFFPERLEEAKKLAKLRHQQAGK